MKWKNQLICICLGLLLGGAAYLGSEMDQDFSGGYILKRNSYGEGDAVYQLLVEGLDKKGAPLEIRLSERAYTKEEASKVYEDILGELPRYILGDNSSLKEVRSNLNLLTGLNRYGVRLSWESSDSELVDSFGEVKNADLEEQGRPVNLTVRMTEGNWPREYTVPIEVKPPVFTKEEQMEHAFTEMLSAEDKRQSTEETMELPRSYQGKSLSYKRKKESLFLPMAGLGVAAACLLFVKEKTDGKKKEAMRKQQIMLDYSEVLARLILFLGAGMSIRTAWDKVSFEYERMVESGARKPRHIYKEMYEASCQMQRGVSQGKVFVDFGRRCGVQPCIKLGALLEQNRKNGSGNLRDTLKLEMSEAFEQRKHQARRLGEEAGTRLLVPLFLLLSIVMVMIAVPALMEFR